MTYYYFDMEANTKALARQFARMLPRDVGKEETEKNKQEMQRQFKQAQLRMVRRLSRELGGDNKYNADGSLKV